MRRTKTITITDEGRDQGKTFILTEMPATLAERWATQAMYLLAQAGAAVSDETQAAGMAGLASVPVASVAQLRALQDPSLDGWRECVRYQHKANHPPQPIAWDSDACQIEEVRTITQLRMAVLELHTGFFSPDAASTSDSPSPLKRRGS